jgi:hypothetical protein
MFQPHAEVRPDLVFLAKLRYQDLHEQLTPEQQSWPMSPLMITFVQHGLRRGVGREALILACLLETEAVTFIPEAVAGAWTISNRKSSTAGQEMQASDDRGDHDRCQTLLDLCRVLEELPTFLDCAFVQMGEDVTGSRTKQKQQRKQKLMDVKVSVNRLNKASPLWWKIDCNNKWPPSTLSKAETMNALTSAFAVVFPECVAVKSNDRWFSAGHRVRGAALKNAAEEDAVILREAKPSRWKKEGDHSGHI